MPSYTTRFGRDWETGEYYATCNGHRISYEDSEEESYADWQDRLLDEAESAAEQAAEARMDEAMYD